MNETPFEALDSDLSVYEPDDEKLYVTEEICDYWRESSRWSGYLAGIGLMLIGLICLVCVFTISMIGAYILIVAALVLVIFIPVRNLHRYAVNIRKAADHGEWDAMEKAFANLSTVYTIYGMLSILAALLLLIALVIAGFMLLPGMALTF